MSALNETLTRTVTPTIDLSNKNAIKFDIYSSRTGSNIKIGIHDSGGTTTEITPNITDANTWQTIIWDISGVSNANKDAIDSIIITIVNADAANTFYIDNFYSPDSDVTITPSALALTLSLGGPAVISKNPYDYRIEIRDTDFNLLEILDNEALNIQWEYNRLGGCGNFSFRLNRKYDELGNIGGDFNIRIYVRDDIGNYTLWYQGLVEDRTPNLGNNEYVDVKGNGYISQLERIYLTNTYSSQEVSVIVKDILDTYVTPNTDVTYEAADIVATSFTPDTLEFKNITALSALQQLAELVGTREWGVDKNRKFFFKARSETQNFSWFVGKDIIKLNDLDTYRSIVNRIKIEGGDVTGTKFTRTVNDAASQAKYGLREQVVSNAAIVSNNVADQYGQAIMAEKSDISRRISCELVNDVSQIEASIPLGTVAIRTPGVRYGEDYYGTFLYCGILTYQISSVNYSIGTNGELNKKITLGQKRPNTSENLKRLEYELEQLRAARE